MISNDDIKILNINMKTNYYLGDTEYNNYYIKVELLPEDEMEDTILLYFNNKVLYFAETDESFRSDMWNKDLNGQVIFIEEKSSLLKTLLENSSYTYSIDDLKHFVIATYNQIVDVVTLENPIILLSNGKYNKEFDYETNYINDFKIYKDTFEMNYPKISQILKDLNIDPKTPFKIKNMGINENEYSQEFESTYLVKGNIINDKSNIIVEGINIDILSMENINNEDDNIILKKPYFEMILKNIKLSYK